MVLKNKKALKLVVCMSLIVALVVTGLCISAKATFENTHYNSGNQSADIVGVAQTQVGYGEGYDGYTKYGDWYGLPNSDWCAMFVSWCANQAGVDTSVFPSFALCSAGCDWFISQGRFHYSGSYAPQAGDLIFYSSYGNIYHVGLVTGSDDYNVYSIEGNYNEMVSNVSYSLSYGDILGYASPAYNTSGSVTYNDTTNDDDYNDYNYYYEDSEEDSDDYDTYSDYYSDDSDDDNYYYEDEDTDSEIYDSDDNDYYFEETDSEEYEDTDSATDFEEDSSDDSDEFDIYEDVTDSDTEEDTDTTYEIESTDTEEDSDSDFDSDSDSDLEVAYILGDVNGDGKITAFDALCVQRYLALDSTEEEVVLLNADVNGSGYIDIGDAIAILEMITGLRV